MSKPLVVSVSFLNVYKFKNWTFEYKRDRMSGAPWPLKKDRTPRERAGMVFWNIFDEFSKLSDKDQDKFQLVQE